MKKIKVLIVCSANSGGIAPFIKEQVADLKHEDVEFDFFLIKKKGIWGYLHIRRALLEKMDEFNPHIIHAHFGLSGLSANLQRKVPVVTTYHGSDINRFIIRIFSIISILLSAHNIFVSKKLVTKVNWLLKSYTVIPCGVDTKIFFPMKKEFARNKLGIDQNKKIVLFSSTFSRFEKNASLAIKAINNLPNVELIELDGYSREEVCLHMNACDVGLLTSVMEGSPMFVKELMACNRPIVSTNVGDVDEYLSGIDGCYIVPFDAEKVSQAVSNAITFEKIIFHKELLEIFDNKIIAKKIFEVYKSLIN